MLIPYEHKRGRSARGQDETAEAWASDRLQIIAYAALLEEHTGRTVTEGRVRYHADNTMVRVPMDEEAYADLQQAIARARELQSSVERPPVTDNERLCVRCSLAPVCLPEEARLAQQPERQTTRLFPADDDRSVLHVLTQGAKVGRKGRSVGSDRKRRNTAVVSGARDWPGRPAWLRTDYYFDCLPRRLRTVVYISSSYRNFLFRLTSVP